LHSLRCSSSIMADDPLTAHLNGGCCDHDHGAHGGHDHKIKNEGNLDLPAEADIDLDAMHPDIKVPKQQFPLTEQELADGFQCVTEDGGIKKKIITESKVPELGSPPNNSKVICHYTGTLPDGNDEKFDSSRDRDDPFTFKIGNGRVIKGWDEGIATMKKGERCILRCASPYAYGENGSPPKIPGGATLDFDVELIDWDDWNECDGADGKISKRVVIASEGGFDDEVQDDAVVTVSYRAYWTDSDGDHILVERKESSMTVGDDDRFTEGFHTAIKSMKTGEKALFKILDDAVISVDDVFVDPEELKTNEFNNNKQVAPDGKQTFYEIHVHEMKKSKEKWNAENEEKIEEGFKYKEAGNVLFKGQRFKGAISKYEKALEWIDSDFSDDELSKKKQELTISANNNMALIFMKMKDWSAATEHATKALEVEPNNLKALMRRAQSRLQNGFLEEAKEDLKRAQLLDKENVAIKKMLKICTARHKAYVQKQQKLYANMFGGKKKKNKKKKARAKAAEPATTETASMELDGADEKKEEAVKADAAAEAVEPMDVDDKRTVSV